MRELLSAYARDPDATWVCGGFGALAEFHFDEGEEVSFTDGATIGAATARGAFRLDCVPELRAVAYETMGKKGKYWGQGLVLCLPEKQAYTDARTVVTELGADIEAIRPGDRSAILFDLGIGKSQSDICVRTADPRTIDLLRGACGKSFFGHGHDVAVQMPALSPHRVFRSKVARVEVYQPIPPPDGKTPDGPHTHVRLNLVKHRRSHAATVPVPQGWLPVLWLFPPHPLQRASGAATPFDAGRYQAFQDLLRRFGDTDALVGKSAASEADVSTRAGRLGFRIAQRQSQVRQQYGA